MLLTSLVFLRTYPRSLLALAHCSSDLLVPREVIRDVNTSAETASSWEPAIWYRKMTGLSFLVIRSALHLLKLNFRLAESDYVTRSNKSSWSCSASRVDVISLKIFALSAKAASWLDLTASGREFTYRRNNVGPRIHPCGTPEVTDKGLDVVPNVVTRWDRLYRYDSSHVRRGSPQNHTDVASLGALRDLSKF